jgi:LPXTG-motif cell wall-anchored protein
MGRRTRAVMAVIAILAFGAIASPAMAQESIEGFTFEECVVALAANSGVALSAGQRAELEALKVTGATRVKEVFGALFDGPDDPEVVVAEDVTLGEICTIYGTDVLPIRFERNGNGAGNGNGQERARVLGVTERRPLPVTGTDAALIAVFGLGLLGLGYVALRRSRDQSP